MTNSKTFKDAALEYAEHGFYVIPLNVHATSIANNRIICNPTKNLQRIKACWEEEPDYNVGLYLPANIIVIDLNVDPVRRNEDGIRSFEWYEQRFGPLPATASCSTEYGGRRLFYKTQVPYQGDSEIYPGIRYKGDVCVIAPPSRTYWGDYQWEKQSILDGITEADKRVRDFCKKNTGKLDRWYADFYLHPDDLPAYLVVPKGGELPFLIDQMEKMQYMGYTPEFIAKKVLELNQKHCNPPCSEKVIREELFYEIDGKLCAKHV